MSEEFEKRLNNIMLFVENAVIIPGYGYDYRKAIRMLYEGWEYDDVLHLYNTQIGAE
jgi:hypothetical protein